MVASPGHRKNILMREATHVGLGIVTARGWLYSTEIFALPTPDEPPEQVRTRLWNRAGTRTRDEDLDRIAQRFAPHIPLDLASGALDTLGDLCAAEAHRVGLGRFDLGLVAQVGSAPRTFEVSSVRRAARAGIGPANIRTRTDRHGRTLYLVQIGSFETRQQAISASRGLSGHEVMVVTVDPSS